MHSFIFPEDLDPPTIPTQLRLRAASRTEKLQQAFPVAAPVRPRRPLPILIPTYGTDDRPKDEVVVSITRLSLDERSPRLQKNKEKRSSGLSRWKSATLSKSEKEDRESRMALLEAERVAHQHARIDRRQALARKNNLHPLSPLVEDHEQGRNSPHTAQMDYGITHVMF